MDHGPTLSTILHTFNVQASKVCGYPVSTSQIFETVEEIQLIALGVTNVRHARSIIAQIAYLYSWYPRTFYQIDDQSFFFSWRKLPIPDRVGASDIEKSLESILRLKARLSPHSIFDSSELYANSESRSSGCLMLILVQLGYQVTVQCDDKLYLSAVASGNPPIYRFSLSPSPTLAIVRAFLEHFEE